MSSLLSFLGISFSRFLDQSPFQGTLYIVTTKSHSLNVYSWRLPKAVMSISLFFPFFTNQNLLVLEYIKKKNLLCRLTVVQASLIDILKYPLLMSKMNHTFSGPLAMHRETLARTWTAIFSFAMSYNRKEMVNKRCFAVRIKSLCAYKRAQR